MKVRTVICVIAALFVFSGASPWEGAAAIAPEGELPAAGRYIATNSFPRNTIVDITNIETGRSTRVIVSNSLNSPGLLAIVSRDAAELIGMRPGSISRIRMIQPSDPIAYLRFTEGINAGIPEYDSGNVITEKDLLDEVYSGDTYSPSAAAENREEEPQKTQADRIMGPSYVLEPEWEGQGRNIIDLPGYVVYPEPEQRPPGPVTGTAEETPRTTVTERPQSEIVKDVAWKTDETPNDEVVKDISEYAAEAPREEVDKDIPEYTGEMLFAEAEKEASEGLSEEPREEVEKDIPEYIAETVREEAEKDIPEKIEEAPREDIAKDIPERTEESVQVAETPERTEESVQVAETPQRTEESVQVAETPQRTEESVQVAETPQRTEESVQVAETPQRTEESVQVAETPRRPEEQTEYNLVPTEERPPQNNTIYGIDPSDIIPGVTTAREPARPQTPAVTPTVTPEVTPTVTPTVADAAFSIPRIFSLDRGRYYVQIAALDSPESVEAAVRQIDRSYQPVVYKDGDNWYRLLLGPMNQGESAAVLQRFKSIGFKDAFVRRGG